MSELKQIKWQQELLKCKDKKVLCNVGRRQGKNFAMWLEIMESQPERVVIISKASSNVEYSTAIDKIDEIRCMNIYNIHDVNLYRNSKGAFVNKIILTMKDGSKLKDIYIYFMSIPEVEKFGIKDINKTLVIMQECIEEKILEKYKNPFGVVAFISNRDVKKSKEVLFDRVIKSGIADAIKQGLYNEKMVLDIIEEGYVYLKEFDILNECKVDFLETTLRSLEDEYLKIIPASNNVMSRKNILEIILGVKKEIRESKIY